MGPDRRPENRFRRGNSAATYVPATPEFWYLRAVDRAALSSNLDWLVAARGDPVKGLPATAWAEKLEGVDRNELLRAAIAVTRLLVQEWVDQHKDDKRP